MSLSDLNIPLFEIPGFNRLVDSLHFEPAVRKIALALHREGFAVLRFPEPEFDAIAERIKSVLGVELNLDQWRKAGHPAIKGVRVQDAWKSHEDVRRLAVNDSVLALLSKVYGRRAWPFQTLNFPVGTEQHFHSDAVHFHSIPERFMCGVWVALEDVDESSGPLEYYPGSHKWPIISNDNLGIDATDKSSVITQEMYHDYWERMVAATGVERRYFCPQRGDALIWVANLLHGGSKQLDPARTRWSQVTHYYFDNCAYLTPMRSNPAAGVIDWRSELRDVQTNQIIKSNLRLKPQPKIRLPEDFDPERYLELNPDVAAAGDDPVRHYLLHGAREGRRY